MASSQVKLNPRRMGIFHLLAHPPLLTRVSSSDMFVQCFELFADSTLATDGQADKAHGLLPLLGQALVFQPVAPCNTPESPRQF